MHVSSAGNGNVSTKCIEVKNRSKQVDPLGFLTVQHQWNAANFVLKWWLELEGITVSVCVGFL